MKYYKLQNNRVKEIKKENDDIQLIRPAKIYKNKSCLYGKGEAVRKFLSIIAAIKRSIEMENYFDKVANNWIEKIKRDENDK